MRLWKREFCLRSVVCVLCVVSHSVDEEVSGKRLSGFFGKTVRHSRSVTKGKNSKNIRRRKSPSFFPKGLPSHDYLHMDDYVLGRREGGGESQKERRNQSEKRRRNQPKVKVTLCDRHYVTLQYGTASYILLLTVTYIPPHTSPPSPHICNKHQPLRSSLRGFPNWAE